MKKILILNQNSPVVTELFSQLQEIDGLKVTQFQGDLQSPGDYAAALTGVDWLLAALGPLDVDLDFEALFDAIEETAPKIQHFIMLSYAGIDDELTAPTNYPKVPNRPEFIKQQRYAIKLVDESEIPYSIIRMNALINRERSTYRLFNEGAAMPVGQVAAKNVADLVLKAFVNQELLNQSVGIVDVNDNH